MLVDISVLRGKLAAGESLKRDEAQGLLQELEHFRDLAACLAISQAVTLEKLPKSAGKPTRKRHADLCELTANLLSGPPATILQAPTLAAARDRLRQAAGTKAEVRAEERSEQITQAPGATDTCP